MTKQEEELFQAQAETLILLQKELSGERASNAGLQGTIAILQNQLAIRMAAEESLRGQLVLVQNELDNLKQ